MSKTVQELCDEFHINAEDFKIKLDNEPHKIDVEKSICEHCLMDNFKEIDFDTYYKLRMIELLKMQNHFLEQIALKVWDED